MPGLAACFFRASFTTALKNASDALFDSPMYPDLVTLLLAPAVSSGVAAEAGIEPRPRARPRPSVAESAVVRYLMGVSFCAVTPGRCKVGCGPVLPDKELLPT